MRILLIEEDESDARKIRAMLPAHQVDWVRNAALADGVYDMRLEGRGPDLLLMDDALEKAHLDTWGLERAIRYARSEQTRRESEERLGDVLDSSSDLIHTAAPDGRLLYVNRTWRDALGFSPGEVANLRIDDVVVTEHRDAFRRVVERALGGERMSVVDTVFVTKSGRRLVVSGYVTPRFEHGKAVATHGGFRDVTEQRRAEEAQRRLVATLEATADLVAIYTMAGHTVYLNRAGRRLVGISDGAGIAELSVETLHSAEARRHMWEVALPGAIRDGSWTGETTVRGADGKDVPVSQAIVAHQSAQGGVWFLSTIMRDISAWKALDRLKNEFVSTVSHELRTPLTSIRGALGLLDAGVSGELGPRGRELVRVARENCERLIRLINDMLDLDKIEAGRMTLALTTCAPAEIVRAAVSGIAGTADVYGIRLEQVVGSTRSVRADHDRIVQVLLNLISNAIKFSPTGSVVCIRTLDGARGVRFAIENPGPGIEPADRERLFRRFQQLDGADNRQRGGTGLGLVIAKAIVEQHGGEIGFESEPGVKTTFWFEL